MAWEADLYSRVVTWAKIILPLVALGLLSTLFLISRTVDPTQKPPVSQVDLEQRARDQGLTNPSFAGTTSAGDEIMFRARIARPDLEVPDRMSADDVVAEIRLSDGAVIDITADHADMHQGEFTASMDGNVTIETSSGYTLRSDMVNARYDQLFVETPGAVEGEGPPGTLSAGKMQLVTNAKSDNTELLFTDGVKLVYKPNKPKD